MAMKFNKNFNVGRVVRRVVYAVLALYVGGQIITELGNVMVCTYNPFYQGISLIGWTVSDNVVVNASNSANTLCNTTIPVNGVAAGTWNNMVTSTSGTGILSVVGIIAIAGVVMEFVSF